MGGGPVNASRAQSRSPASPARARLIEELRRQGITDERVLGAISKVPRHDFIDGALQNRAYENNALPIGHAQTISQPTVVALMTQALTNGKKLKRVLEIGTGCGYQTAVLAELVDTVFTIERIKALTEIARKRLGGLGYKNIHFGYADGSKGWAAYAPYDGIMVTAAADEVPLELLEQMAPQGRLLIPAGPPGAQSLLLLEKTARGITRQNLASVSFVPLLQGRA